MEEGGRAGSDEESPEQPGGHSPFFLPSGITDFDDEHSYDPNNSNSNTTSNSNNSNNTNTNTSGTTKLYGFWPENPSYEVKKVSSSNSDINSKLWAFNVTEGAQFVSDPEPRDTNVSSKSQDEFDPTTGAQEDPKNMVFRVERSGSESSYVYTFNPRIHIPASHPMADPASNNHSDNVRFMATSPWKIRHSHPPSREITPPSTPPHAPSTFSPTTNTKPVTPPSTNSIRSERAGSLTGKISAAQRTAQPRPLSSPPKMLTPIYNAIQNDHSGEQTTTSPSPQYHQLQHQNQYRETPQPPPPPGSKTAPNPATPPRTLQSQSQPYHSPTYQQHSSQAPIRQSRNRPGSNSYPTPVPYVIVPQGHTLPVASSMYRPMFHPHRSTTNTNMMPANPAAPVQYWNGTWAYAAPQQVPAPQSPQYIRQDGRADKKFKSPKRGSAGASKKNRASTGSANYPGTITMAVVDKPVWKVKGRSNTINGSLPSYSPKATQRYEQNNRGSTKQTGTKKDGENQMEYKQIKLLRRDDPNSQAYLNGTASQETISQMNALKLDQADEDGEDYEEDEDEDDREYDGDDFHHGHGGGEEDGDDSNTPGGGSPTSGGPTAGGNKRQSGSSGNNSPQSGQDRRGYNHNNTHSKQYASRNQTIIYDKEQPTNIHATNNNVPANVGTKRDKIERRSSDLSQAEKDAVLTASKKLSAADAPIMTVEKSAERRPLVARLLSFFAIGIGLLCATVFTVLSLLLHIHRVALTSGASASTFFIILCVYAFPLLASIVSIVTWGPQFVWFVFLTWFCVMCGSSSNSVLSSANTSLYIRLLVLVFFIEGAYEGNFVLKSSGGERIVLAAVLVGLKAGRTIISTGHILALALAVGFGSYMFVQWAILLAVLTAEGHHQKTSSSTTAIPINNYTIAKKQFALRKIRRYRVNV